MNTTVEGPVCIIGMHRSGTSMIARLLNLCGLNLGPEEKLLGSNSGNLAGHFEHTGFLEIDEALLSHFRGSWDNPPAFRPGWEHDPSLRKWMDEAKSVLDSFSGCSRWGWKEPRTTILLPFWKLLVPDVRFVICVRNPLEVAQSLTQRDGISIAAGGYLWSRYTRAAIQDTEGSPRIFTFYEDYFRDGSAELDRIIEFCDLERPDDPSRLRDAISHELRHRTSKTQELLDSRGLAMECKLLYIGLRGLSFDNLMPTSCRSQRKDSVSENVGSYLRLLDELHSEEMMAQLQTVLSEKDQQLSMLECRLAIKEQAAMQLQNQIDQLQDRADRLQAFSDVVRQTLAYRFYSRFIKPLRP